MSKLTTRALCILASAVVLMGLGLSHAQTVYFQGTEVSTLSGRDDDAAGPFNIGFSFEVYGTAYTQFYVSTNGQVSFGGSNTAYTNASLPRTYTYPVLYTFWDDLMSYGADQPILYKTIAAAEANNPFGSDILVIQWTNYGYYNSTLPMGTFQTILVSGSYEIYYNYFQLLSPRSSGNSATIGIQDSYSVLGTDNHQYSHHTDAVDSETYYSDAIYSGEAIRYQPDGSGSYTTPAAASSSNFVNLLLYETDPPPGAVSSLSPDDEATDVSVTPSFSWDAASGAVTYGITISENANLNSPVVDVSGLATPSYTVTTALDYETTYYWIVTATNSGGDTYSALQSFTTRAENSAPTAMSLSSTSVAQSDGVNAVVGTLSATDPDAGDSHSFTLVSGTGDDDNASFNISGSSLRANDAGSLAHGSYSVRVRATDSGTNTFDQTFSVSVSDDVSPSVTSVTPPANGSYGAGQSLDFVVNFDEAVTVDTAGGTPSLELTVGSSTESAAYVSGSGSSALTFRYTVQTGDADSDGPGVGANLSLNGGSLADAQSNAAGLALSSVGSTSGVLIDGVVPTITSVTPAADGSYGVGANLSWTLNLSEAVTVDTAGGTPRLALDIGGETRYADFVSGSGSNSLVFSYTVQAGDEDADGPEVSALEPNGGSLTDAAGNALDTTLNSLGDASGVTVDGVAPVVTEVTGPGAGSYGVGQNLDIEVTLSEAVTVDTTAGTPIIDIAVGSETRQASFLSGSGTDTLVFRYTVQAGDDATGVTLGGSIDLSGGTLTDNADNDLVTTLNDVSDTSGVVVDGAVPTIASVDVPADAIYATGDVLTFTLNLSEAVTVDTTDGTPSLAVTIGSDVRQALYQSGSGTDTLTFSYTVQAGEDDADGLELASTLNANGASLSDTAGNALDATLTSVGDLSGVKVDALQPDVVSVTAPAAGTYGTGDALDLSLILSEAATVDTTDGTPTLTLNDGTRDLTAVYVSGSGSDTLVFRYIVQQGDDSDTLTVSSSEVELSGGRITDAKGNPLEPALNNVDDLSGVEIRGVHPGLVSVVLADSYAANSAAVQFTATFSEAVSGVDLSDFGLVTTGSASATLSALSGSGTSYTLSLSSITGTGSLRVDLKETGTDIENAAGNPVLNGFSAGEVHTVDLDAPVIEKVVLERPGPFKRGEQIRIAATFSEEITTGGAPKLPFSIGATALEASLQPTPGARTLIFAYEVGETDAFSGNLSVTAPDLSGGTLNDLSGNIFDPASFGGESLGEVLVKGTLPDAPQDLSASAEGATNDETVSVSGQAEPGATVLIRSSLDGQLTTVVADGSGDWQAEVTLSSEGEHVLTAVTVDEAGNESEVVSSTPILLDQTPPGSASGLEPSVAPYTRQHTFNLSGQAEPGSAVTIRSDLDGTLTTVVADEDGNWQAEVSLTSEGEHTLSAEVTDPAGNVNIETASTTIVLRSGPPAAPIFAQADLGASNQTDQRVSGSAEPHIQVEIRSDTDGLVGVTTADADGNWTLELELETEGPHELSAVAVTDTDERSEASDPAYLTLDLSAPTVTGVAANTEAQPFAVGEALTFTVTFSEAVTVDDDVILTFEVGGELRQATLISTDGETAQFSYLVQADDALTGDLNVAALSADTGEVVDLAGNPLDFEAVDTSDTLGQVAIGVSPSRRVVPGVAMPEAQNPVSLITGQSNIPVLQFTLETSSFNRATTVEEVVLGVDIRGNALDEIVGSEPALEPNMAFHLIYDLNENGELDDGEARAATATALDEGGETLTLVLDEALTIDADEQATFLIVIHLEDKGTTALALVLALGLLTPFLIRRRPMVASLFLAIALLAGCSKVSAPAETPSAEPAQRSITVSTRLEAIVTDDPAFAADGLPIEGLSVTLSRRLD